ncbi:UNVERIFIED_CONTAM: hypothetical protein GTU68_001738, partial [Idotea baltica]|nr:hypothetical protein [Idotea baltica]
VIVVCSKCAGLNRIPEHKSIGDAQCGKCRQAVYQNQPVTLNDSNFFRYIEKNDLPVVVDYWASWCGPCQQMAPIFDSVAQQSDQLIFAKVNTEQATQVSAQAGIRSIPTLIFFHQGQEVDRKSGGLSEAQMKQWIMQCIQKL